MSKLNLNIPPYYDDNEILKGLNHNYTHLLAIPGRNAQAREFTQMQSVLKDIIKSVGDSILQDGNIIEGCQITRVDKEENGTIYKKVKVSEGRIYIDGMVSYVPETEVDIEGVGTEYICVEVVETIETENEETKLRDPAQGYENYGQPGCHRVNRELRIFRGVDQTSTVIAMLTDGELTLETYAPEYDALTQTLARRTFDESGSYIVEGLKVRAEDIYDEEGNIDSDSFNIVIEPGKAYVLGYELKIPSARRLTVPRATDYRTISRTTTYMRDKVNLSTEPYIKEITSVVGEKEDVYQITGSTGASGVIHNINYPNLVSVDRVYQGETEYTLGEHYELLSGSGQDSSAEGFRIQWIGNSPSGTYQCDITYNQTFSLGTDYELRNELVDEEEYQYLVWISGADHPIASGAYTITYESYYARKDIVYMDKFGNIEAIQGNPATYGYELSPEAPLNTLPLSIVTIPPNSTASSNSVRTRINVANIGLTRYTMSDIQYMMNRIRTLEYDQAVLSLDEEAIQTDTLNTKRGVYTDPFIDFSRADLSYNYGGANESLPTYDAALDLVNNLCYLPIESEVFDMTDYLDLSTTTAKINNKMASLPVSGEYTALSQPKATKVHLINPYSIFPQTPEINISPDTDNWIEKEYITVPVSLTQSTIVATSKRHYESTKVLGGRFNDYSVTSTQEKLTATGKKVTKSTTQSVISSEAITYIRSRDITVEGTDFAPSRSGITCYFDGTKMKLTALGDTVQGTNGTVYTNADGYFKAKFTIPKNKFHTGIREVEVSSPEADTPAGYQTSASALYQASGTKMKIQNTVTTITTTLYERLITTNTVNYVDPIGQTFVLDRMTSVRAVEVSFRDKPTTNTPVTCEIRGVENGTITHEVYGRKSLYPKNITTATKGVGLTRFTFSDPILLEGNKEYAVVLKSTSDKYTVWAAELGGIEAYTGETVSKNPYLVGVMLSSSNNSSWTTHQTTDLKFNIIAEKYSPTGIINYKPVTYETARLYLSADADIPVGTSVSWSYSPNGLTGFTEISPYNMTVLDSTRDKIYLRAELKRDSNESASPILHLDSVGLETSYFIQNGYYIMKEVPGLDPYTQATIVVDTHNPGDTNLEFYVSNNGGTTMVPAVLNENRKTQLSYGWVENTYEATMPSSSTNCQVFVKMSSMYKHQTPAIRRLRVIMS